MIDFGTAIPVKYDGVYFARIGDQKTGQPAIAIKFEGKDLVILSCEDSKQLMYGILRSQSESDPVTKDLYALFKDYFEKKASAQEESSIGGTVGRQ